MSTSELNNIGQSYRKPVGVIILNWNGSGLLRRFLPAVIANTQADLADIVVADNGSTDDSVEMLRRDFPQVRLLKFDKNHGYAGGYNRAIAATGYRYTVLLNSDVAPRAGWLAPLYQYMTAHPEVGACQPKILSVKAPDMFEYAGASGGYIDCNGYPYCRGRIFDVAERDIGQYNTIERIFWATGAALMVDTALYQEVGGLDESFFAHMEEIDLCWRMQLAGRSVVVIPASEVEHLGGASLDAANPRKTYLNFRNSLLMLRKNLPAGGRRTRLLIRRRLLDTLAFVRFVMKGQPRHARAILRAHADYRRMTATQTDSRATRWLLPTQNILVEYYLRRHRTFSSIHNS